MRQANYISDSLSRVREVVVMQQQVLAEEQAMALKRENHSTELGGFSGELKANGTFSSGDSKKRRGVRDAKDTLSSGFRQTNDDLEGRAAWQMPQLQPSRDSRMAAWS